MTTNTYAMKSIVSYCYFVLLIMLHIVALSQPPSLFLVPQEEGVYVYHNKQMPSGHGFLVYRQDRPGGDFILLTPEPLRGVDRLDELRSVLGERYTEVLQMMEEETAAGLFMAFKTKAVESTIASALFPEVARVLGRLYVDENAPKSRQLSYRIVFVNQTGLPAGEEISQKVVSQPMPIPIPEIKNAENEGHRVRLFWDYPQSTPGKPDFVTQFYVFRIDPTTNTLQRLNQDILLRNNAIEEYATFFESPVINTTERYVVTAVDITGRQGEPGFFEFELIDNVPPEPVRGLTANVINEKWVNLRWNLSDEPAVSGFKVYRGTELEDSFTQITEMLIAPDNPTYADSAVTGGNTYYYYVSAVKEGGFESIMGELVMASLPDLVIPPAPVNMMASFDLSCQCVKLSWELETPSADIETFILLRRREDVIEPGAYERIHHDNLTALNYEDVGGTSAGFTEGSRLRYIIFSLSKARNASDTSSIEVDIPLITPPDPPTGFTVINENGHRANISWNASPSVNTAKYLLYRKMLDDPTFALLTEMPTDARFMRDEDLVTGQHYVYALTAKDRADNESDFTATDSLFFRDFTPPGSVRNIQAVERETGIELSWERVVSTDFAGYIVYRSGIPTGIYQPLHEGLIRETSFFDAQGDATMWYRVRAIDTSGNESLPGRPIRPLERTP